MDPSSSSPKVSILMLTYDRPHLIGRAIQSVIDQTFQDWELVIVQDGTNAEIELQLRAWCNKEPRVHHFRRGTVESIAKASNFGLKKARGEYVAILDDDDYWAVPEKLERQIDFLDTHIDHVACAGGYIVIDATGRELGRFLKPSRDCDIRARALVANPIANSTAVFRRKVGGSPVSYDETQRQFADWGFWLMMGTLGKIYNFNEHLAFYTLWESGSSFKHQKDNAKAALKIAFKYRSQYRGFPVALMSACLYFCYAHLPEALRYATYKKLSAIKKALTGMRGSAVQA